MSDTLARLGFADAELATVDRDLLRLAKARLEARRTQPDPLKVKLEKFVGDRSTYRQQAVGYLYDNVDLIVAEILAGFSDTKVPPSLDDIVAIVINRYVHPAVAKSVRLKNHLIPGGHLDATTTEGFIGLVLKPYLANLGLTLAVVRHEQQGSKTVKPTEVAYMPCGDNDLVKLQLTAEYRDAGRVGKKGRREACLDIVKVKGDTHYPQVIAAFNKIGMRFDSSDISLAAMLVVIQAHAIKLNTIAASMVGQGFHDITRKLVPTLPTTVMDNAGMYIYRALTGPAALPKMPSDKLDRATLLRVVKMITFGFMGEPVPMDDDDLRLCTFLPGIDGIPKTAAKILVAMQRAILKEVLGGKDGVELACSSDVEAQFHRHFGQTRFPLGQEIGGAVGSFARWYREAPKFTNLWHATDSLKRGTRNDLEKAKKDQPEGQYLYEALLHLYQFYAAGKIFASHSSSDAEREKGELIMETVRLCSEQLRATMVQMEVGAIVGTADIGQFNTALSQLASIAGSIDIMKVLADAHDEVTIVKAANTEADDAAQGR